MFASSAFGSIGNELKGDKKETVKSTFSGDTIISALIAAAPSGMLMIMLFFTPQLYTENGIDPDFVCFIFCCLGFFEFKNLCKYEFKMFEI